MEHTLNLVLSPVAIGEVLLVPQISCGWVCGLELPTKKSEPWNCFDAGACSEAPSPRRGLNRNLEPVHVRVLSVNNPFLFNRSLKIEEL